MAPCWCCAVAAIGSMNETARIIATIVLNRVMESDLLTSDFPRQCGICMSGPTPCRPGWLLVVQQMLDILGHQLGIEAEGVGEAELALAVDHVGRNIVIHDVAAGLVRLLEVIED